LLSDRVEGHFNEPRAWVHIDELPARLMSSVVGALPHEVAIMNSLTVNLNLLMVAFYRPDERRYKILVEENLFCSDSVRGFVGDFHFSDVSH
jgi:kynureninase